MTKKRNHDVRLVLRNGRLTEDYFILREAWLQGFRPRVRPHFHRGSYKQHQYWRVGLMIKKGYLENTKEPRSGDYFFRATSEGAFQMMVAEGIAKHLSEKFNDPKNVARRAKANERRRQRLALAKVSQACSAEQETCSLQAMVPQ